MVYKSSSIHLLFSLVLLLVLFPCVIYSQGLSNLREKYISTKIDTVQIDTLSIIQNTISITDGKGGGIDSALYTIDYTNAILVWTDKLNADPKYPEGMELKISYRVFPYSFSKSYKHKDIKNIESDQSGTINPFIYTYNRTKSDIFKLEGLNKSGSISRGISFGNNQDVIVNSSLDLQLSGKLSNNINILAAITDNNIPIQPEGNTQQIQEFDKVFIQLSDEKSKLIAGDFELKRPKSHFMNFYKKAQGVSFETSFRTDKFNKSPAKEVGQEGKMKITVSAAVSKGKYARHAFTGTEGNQGPYKLRGSENETFIIVLSGTEKVHIDGELLTRGQENDYVIDYNTAEITFTPKRLITKDKRIVVEFQYSEKNYTRSLLFAGGDFKKNKLNLRFNVYSEQDAKNQSLFQDLNSENKQLLSEIGDDLDSAIALNIDSMEFVSDQVLYKKIDTIVASVPYKDVYIYSTDPDSAFYRLGFSRVVDEEGDPNGNYVQVNTTVNGRVFKWVAPDSVTGLPQGSYEPIVLLITPKKKQLVIFGGDYTFSKQTKVSFEVAGSNNDINTFSSKDRNDDVGYAFKVNFQNIFPISNSAENPWMFKSILSYEQIDRHFSPIERYRSVEYERDWNLGGITTSENEYIPGLDLFLSKKKTGVINYQFKSFFKGSEYNAYKNRANLNLNKNNFRLIFDGSLLNTTTRTNNTQFVRSKASISKQFRWFTLGVMEEQERNIFKKLSTDTLQPNSFEFYEWGVFVNNADTAINKFTINYKQRTDLAPLNKNFKKSTIGESVGFTLDMLKNPRSRFIGNVTYRKLSIQDTSISINKKEENSLISRLEYRFKLLKGTITSSTFYEIGSGLEVKKEIVYLEVAAGQGVYTWSDYNNNGIKELNEFPEAAFQDQANYIKVAIPTNDYIKTFTNLFNEVLYIKPSIIWNRKTGIRKFVARFANRTTYRIDRKTTNNENLLSAYNPFLTETTDTNLVTLNSSFRNTLYFNRTNSKFGIDINYQDVRNKALLINNTTSRVNTVKGIRFRWNMNRKFTTNLIYNLGEKKNTSKLFSSKSYEISYYEAEPKLTYQPNVKFRISVLYNLKNKENKLLRFLTDSLDDVSDTIGGGENSIHHKIGIEIKHNVVSKGSLLMKVNFINISYDNPYDSNTSTNTSLAFEMLEGLQIGQNITWNLTYQRTLSKYMQLSITYDGRSSEGVNTIHTGGVQLRAFF